MVQYSITTLILFYFELKVLTKHLHFLQSAPKIFTLLRNTRFMPFNPEVASKCVKHKCQYMKLDSRWQHWTVSVKLQATTTESVTDQFGESYE